MFCLLFTAWLDTRDATAGDSSVIGRLYVQVHGTVTDPVILPQRDAKAFSVRMPHGLAGCGFAFPFTLVGCADALIDCRNIRVISMADGYINLASTRSALFLVLRVFEGPGNM